VPRELQINVKVKINVRATMSDDTYTHISAGLAIRRTLITHYRNIESSILRG